MESSARVEPERNSCSLAEEEERRTQLGVKQEGKDIPV